MTQPTAPTPEARTVPSPPAYQPPPPQPAATDPRRKSPLLASVLSLMPGLGQIYVGYYQRGFTHIFIAAIIITLLANEVSEALMPLLGLFLAFFWFYNVVDAWRRAALYNHALAGQGADVVLPDDFTMPSLRGSVSGGVTIAVIGFILLLNTRFHVSLEWVEEWWPLAFILFGGYLIWKALQEKSGAEGSREA